MSILLTILFVVLFFRITGFLLGICGRILGGLLSLVGYTLIGLFAIAVLGLAFYTLPLVLLAGIGAIATGVARV
jgi:hypothetical protein